MLFLKADTAATVLIGPFLDKTDGVTPETGVTLAGADSAEIMKHDGTTFQDASGLTFTHKAHGMYTLAITSGFLDTEGRLVVFISDESLCLPVWAEFMVVNANVYDSLFAAATTDYLEVDIKQISSDANAADNAELAFDGTGYGFTGCTVPTVTTLTGHTAQTGDNYARLGAPAGVSIAADIAENQTDLDTILEDTDELQGDWVNDGRLDLILDAIQADTDELQTDDIPGTLATLNDISAADVWDATEAITGNTLSFETIMARIYRFLFNKMNITDADGSVALRNEADGGDIMTNSITDNDTTTVRTAGSWA